MERVDQASDAAAMAELTTHHPTFDRVFAGRSLRFEAKADTLADLQGYATDALALFRRDDYTKDQNYSWIDYTVPVADRAEAEKVLDELYVQATAAPPASVDLVWADADPDTGVTPSFACFPGERATKTSSKRTELPWAAALSWLQAKRPGKLGRDALRTKIRFYDDDLRLSAGVELWSLLVAQVAIGSDTFMISDGEVWRASPTHIADIDSLLAPRVVVNPSYLPAYTAGESEGRYNQRAATFGAHFLLDKRLVRIPGQTSFEPCDLLSADGLFMHVKRKTSSATMSHVVAQALASTQMLRNVDQARDLLDDALRSQVPPNPRLADMRDHCASFSSRPTGKVVVVIIGSWRGAPDITQLPLLTRISLSGWLRQMPCEAGVVLVGT